METTAQKTLERQRTPSTSAGEHLPDFGEEGTIGKTFIDRRQVVGGTVRGVSPEVMQRRRQFPTPEDAEAVPPAAKELQRAIDVYKMEHGLKRISVVELLGVLEKLGYHRD